MKTGWRFNGGLFASRKYTKNTSDVHLIPPRSAICKENPKYFCQNWFDSLLRCGLGSNHCGKHSCLGALAPSATVAVYCSFFLFFSRWILTIAALHHPVHGHLEVLTTSFCCLIPVPCDLVLVLVFLRYCFALWCDVCLFLAVTLHFAVELILKRARARAHV